jgi:hypothetical protein
MPADTTDARAAGAAQARGATRPRPGPEAAPLVLAKLITVATPVLYKAAVDVLAGESEGSPALLLALGRSG